MPLILGALDAGNGGGPALGPETNTFGDSSTADRAAAEALRDAYAGANAAWLALYNANRAFLVLIQWNGGESLQRRNVAGDDWEDVTNAIRGPRGPAGSAASADGRLRIDSGAPGAALGVDGGAYIDRDTGDLYTKASGAWTKQGTVEFGQLVAGIRYAAKIADPSAPTEAEWLAGNASTTEIIDMPAKAADEHDGVAIPATQDGLHTIMPQSGIFNFRAFFSPAQSDGDVTQMINGVLCKTYIRGTTGGVRAAAETYVLRPAP